MHLLGQSAHFALCLRQALQIAHVLGSQCATDAIDSRSESGALLRGHLPGKQSHKSASDALLPCQLPGHPLLPCHLLGLGRPLLNGHHCSLFLLNELECGAPSALAARVPTRCDDAHPHRRVLELFELAVQLAEISPGTASIPANAEAGDQDDETTRTAGGDHDDGRSFSPRDFNHLIERRIRSVSGEADCVFPYEIDIGAKNAPIANVSVLGRGCLEVDHRKAALTLRNAVRKPSRDPLCRRLGERVLGLQPTAGGRAATAGVPDAHLQVDHGIGAQPVAGVVQEHIASWADVSCLANRLHSRVDLIRVRAEGDVPHVRVERLRKQQDAFDERHRVPGRRVAGGSVGVAVLV